MKFTPTKISGVYVVDLEKREDERGFFARAFCVNEFADQDMVTEYKQCNISSNYKRGTIRGLHYQIAPHAETKLIRCLSGRIFDVCVDLRPASTTYKQWFGIELSAENYRMLYVPTGFANGYQTLADNSTAYYSSSTVYAPEFERGIRWNDPAFGITWPITDIVILSEKDKILPDYKL